MDEPVGLPLSTFADDLTKVPARFNARPVDTLALEQRIGPHARAYIQSYYGDVDFETVLRKLPMKAFARLSFDDLCKIRYSSIISMDESVEKAFKDEPRYAIVHKITNSMWRWGMGSGVWNDVVDCYDAIRRFTVPIDGMEVRLDYTTSYNECGFSEHSRTFLDGVFAFLLYYRGKHVMTLGFSVMKGRRLLVQQVQLKERRGNRFLFKLPSNHMEYFLGRFRAAFKGFRIHVIDGTDVATKSLKSYRRGLDEERRKIARYRQELKGTFSTPNGRKWTKELLGDSIKHAALFGEKIEHLEADLPRLAAFYGNTGRFRRGSPMKVNGLTHYHTSLS